MQHWILDATAPTNTPTTLTWLPYVIGGVTILVLAYLFYKNRRLKAGKEYYKTRSNKFELELQHKVQAITTLTREKEMLEKELADSELDRKSLEDRLKLMEGKKVQPKAAPPPPVPAAPAVAPLVVKERSAPKLIIQPQSPKSPVIKLK